MNPKLTCSQRQWLHSSVGRASHRYREATGSNPVEVLNFFQTSLRNCKNCDHNCEDHSSFDFISAVHIWFISYASFTSFLSREHVNPKLTCSQRHWLHSSVGRASHRYREVTGSSPVEVLNFFFRLLYTIVKIAIITARIILHLISYPQFTYDLFHMHHSFKIQSYLYLQTPTNHSLRKPYMHVITCTFYRCTFPKVTLNAMLNNPSLTATKLSQQYCSLPLVKTLVETNHTHSNWPKEAWKSHICNE